MKSKDATSRRRSFAPLCGRLTYKILGNESGIGDIPNINCSDSSLANRIGILTGPSQDRFELHHSGRITGPQDSEWGIERLKRCLNSRLANKMRIYVSTKGSLPPRRGRPPMEAAESHATILDAVYELLQERSVRDLTMEAVAKRAGVGKPTL